MRAMPLQYIEKMKKDNLISFRKLYRLMKDSERNLSKKIEINLKLKHEFIFIKEQLKKLKNERSRYV